MKDLMTSGLSDFAAHHWVVGGILTSLLWFFAGRNSSSRKKFDVAIIEQCVAVMLILIVGGWAVAKEEWLGLLFAIGVLYIEIQSIRKISASQTIER